MKIVTWNVNGLRACITKGFYEYASQSGADMICLQETKMQEGQADIQLPGYEQYWNSAVRKGYSGTAVFTKTSPLAVKRHFDRPGHDDEGRVLTLEYEKFYLVNAYSPNAKEKLARIDYRMEWEDALREYLLGLDEKKPVIYCGDLNITHPSYIHTAKRNPCTVAGVSCCYLKNTSSTNSSLFSRLNSIFSTIAFK